ncbi:zf-HC2 domain-containing protein [bacterium]|nr:zf-HC2 domain-containing protein [bacterium]
MGKTLKIKQNEKHRAGGVASLLNNPLRRKMALVDMLGLQVVQRHYKDLNIDFNSKICLHKIPFALEEYRICDLTYNGYRVFVITVFNENFIRIPRVHFNLNITPDFYVVAEIDKNLNAGVVGGFISANDVRHTLSDTNYFYPKISDLREPYELAFLLSKKRANLLPFGKHIDAISLFGKVLDGVITSEEKRKLISHLHTCPNCLNRFLDLYSFNEVSTRMTLVQEKRTNTPATPETKVAQKQIPVTVVPKKQEIKEKITILNETIPPANKGISDLTGFLKSLNEEAEIEQSKINFDGVKTALKRTAVLVFSIFKYIKNSLNTLNLKIKAKYTKKQRKAFITTLLVVLFAWNMFDGDKTSKTTIQKAPQIEQTQMLEPIPQESILQYSTEYSSGHIEPFRGNVDISWDVDKNLASKEEYKNFLQILGKNIKLNLENEFIILGDLPQNKNLQLRIEFSNNASVKNISFITNSGTKQIDDTILNALYEVLSYVKAPRNGIIMPDIELILNISLS